MSLTNCPSCRHWIYTGWGNGMCNLGIGYCRYEMKGDLDGDSLHPSIPIMSYPIINPGLEAEINKQNELLKDIVAELKEIKHVLLTTPPYFKAPDITCSGGEINLCSSCVKYNSPIGQCERGVAGCKYEPDERVRY